MKITLKTKPKSSTWKKCLKSAAVLASVQKKLDLWTTKEHDRFEANDKKADVTVDVLDEESGKSAPQTFTLDRNDLIVEKKVEIVGGGPANADLAHSYDTTGTNLVVLDFTPDLELEKKHLARELVNRVQKLAKEAKLTPAHKVDLVAVSVGKTNVRDSIESKADYVNELLRRKLVWAEGKPEGIAVVQSEKMDLGEKGKEVEVFICAKAPVLLPAGEKLCGGAAERDVLMKVLRTFSADALSSSLEKGELAVNLKEESGGMKSYSLKLGVHVTLD